MPEQFYKDCLPDKKGHTTQYSTKQHNSFVSVRIQNIIISVWFATPLPSRTEMYRCGGLTGRPERVRCGCSLVVWLGNGCGSLVGRPQRCLGCASSDGCSGSMLAGLSWSTEIILFFPPMSTMKVLGPGCTTLNGSSYGCCRGMRWALRRKKTYSVCCRLQGTEVDTAPCWEVGTGTRPRTWSHSCRRCSETSECVCPQLGIKSPGTVRGAPDPWTTYISAEKHPRSSLGAILMPKAK